MSALQRLRFSAEVLDAMASRRPVVALESTILTHGLPRGLNLTLATKLEKIIRDNGAVPAHIAVLDGHPLIGLSDKQLEMLALDESINPLKISRRDLAVASALDRSGGTTVAGTICLASAAGIKHFCTGGLGGVHRGAERTWDVSADLTELGRSPVHVVCAGAKSILDTSLTLEYLETQGVTVASISDTNDFPAFYSPTSGYYSPYKLTPLEAARVSHASEGLASGALFCAPIPAEYAAEGARIQASVDQAISESQDAGVVGKATTPWLLARVAELTQGSSITSNMALIENNAKISSQIAVAYSKLTKGEEVHEQYAVSEPKKPSQPASTPTPTPKPQPIEDEESRQEDVPADVIIIGASALDITSQYRDSVKPIPQSTFPGTVKISLGGVGRNIAEAANRVLRKSPLSSMLVTPVGSDEFASILKTATAQLKMRTDGFIGTTRTTPVVSLLLASDGELREGVSSFDAVDHLTFGEVEKVLQKHTPQLIALDGNVSSGLMADVLAYAQHRKIDTLFEPTSVAKSTRLLERFIATRDLPRLTYATPNIHELRALVQSTHFAHIRESEAYWESLNNLRLFQSFRDALDRHLPKAVTEGGLAQMGVMLLPLCKHVLVKCGKEGVLAVSRISKAEFAEWDDAKTEKGRVVHLPSDGEGVVVQHFKASVVERVVNTTGAGDSFVGALIAALASRKSVMESVKLGNEAAMLTLGSGDSVSARLNYLSDDLEL